MQFDYFWVHVFFGTYFLVAGWCCVFAVYVLAVSRRELKKAARRLRVDS